MQVKFSNRGPTLIAKVAGELDHHSTGYLRQKMDYEIIKATNKNLIMDFSDTGFMDSSGIGLIIGRYKNVKSMNGETVLVVKDSRIAKILEMAGINKMMPVFTSVNEAFESL